MIKIKTDKLQEFIKEFPPGIDVPTKVSKKDTIIDFTEQYKPLLQNLFDTAKLTSVQKSKVSSFLFSSDHLKTLKFSKLNDLYNHISFLPNATSPFLEMKINNKWYPVMVNVSKFETFTGWVIELYPYGSVGGLTYGKNIYIGPWSFNDNAGVPSSKTLEEILEPYGLKIASQESVERACIFNSKVSSFSTLENKVFDSFGSGLIYDHHWGFWSEINMGYKDSPATVVIESKLENKYANRDRDDSWHLPFVRVFSFKHKDYIYVDIEHMNEHTYHTEDKEKIILPPNMLKAINSVFDASKENIFGDLFHGRHGGIVILANGPSGVGKTLTAEVFAEFQERPLYTMEMSEIGTTLKEVESNLKKIFNRAKKWNAVLLFDEADIFLSERVASDLERSAIVGIFLRLLDYYEGTFFLTTNRGDGIDKAFKSRVTLYLDYPELSSEVSEKIWRSMLQSADLELFPTYAPLTEVTAKKLNGRQIRNQVRLLKLMHSDKKITLDDILESLKFTAL